MHKTLDQVVAWNIAWYRRAADMTQQELGRELGWPKNRVSEAERSWDGKRTREFNAQLLADLATALGVPLLALFLPPYEPDASYLFPAPGGRDLLGMDDLMWLVMPDAGGTTPAMNAYRNRFQAAVTRHLDDDWAREVASWLEKAEDKRLLADRAERLAARARELRGAARELQELADAIRPDDDEDGDPQ
jgi:transcriptional regulator with XRE-family HTH domain